MAKRALRSNTDFMIFNVFLALTTYHRQGFHELSEIENDRKNEECSRNRGQLRLRSDFDTDDRSTERASDWMHRQESATD